VGLGGGGRETGILKLLSVSFYPASVDRFLESAVGQKFPSTLSVIMLISPFFTDPVEERLIQIVSRGR
jgi:hypothetical protein